MLNGYINTMLGTSITFYKQQQLTENWLRYGASIHRNTVYANINSPVVENT